MDSLTKEFAVHVLKEDENRIKRLIRNQKNSLCISQCKAFEEVVDTQMYGFSQQVSFAIRVGIIEKDEGQLILSELERELNQLYNDVYQENYEKNESGKEE
ncbi:YlaN family protein [Enterococcus thailandicus]|uniref:YlaN family protein n=1 Tax=Enterococcus thailandicus TaxID=417368 RepID=UPI0022EC100B|nr:YlaN family protein [Enterococcus thailandicus]MDA3963929.1 YlaN family protein [Enterococcus thailandicus]